MKLNFLIDVKVFKLRFERKNAKKKSSVKNFGSFNVNVMSKKSLLKKMFKIGK